MTSLSSGRLTAGQVDCLHPPRVRLAKPAVVYCHSVGANAAEAVGSGLAPSVAPILAALARYGFPIVTPTAPGTWGNGTFQTRAADAVTYARGSLGAHATAPIVLLGVSHGSTGALRYAALNPTLVACVVCWLSVPDLTEVYQRDVGGYQASIAAAYGTSVVTDTITATGTWTCPAGVFFVVAECWGGGGPGFNGAVGTGGGGGGGGAYSKKLAVPVVPSTVYTVTVAATGGGATWFKDTGTCYAAGGTTAVNPTGAAGGLASASTGDTKFNGGTGANGVTVAAGGGGGGGAGTTAVGNNGSGTTAGTGGAANGGTGGAGGATGNNPGAAGSVRGGGGGGGGSSALAPAGGVAGRGEVRVTYGTPLPADTDPALMTAALAPVPLMLHRSSDDAFWTAGNGGADFVTAMGANATEVNVGALGHTDAAIAATVTADVIAFITAHT